MLKLPGCPWALSPVLRQQHIHNRIHSWTTRVDSNISFSILDLIFHHGTYEIWLQCRKKKHLLLLHIITLSLVHWGMQTFLNSLPRQQNCNKNNTANSLQARNRKKSKAWNSQCIPWKRNTAFRETNSPCPGGQQRSVRRAAVSSSSSLLAENDTAWDLLLVRLGGKASDC